MPDSDRAQVQIDAHVIRQLGDQLVTDAEQALLELVKNCWDADASQARITVDTLSVDEANGIGKIAIKDDGAGMDWPTIERGWLTISLSPKRAMKAEGKTTETYHRTPLGDKGLGRLGTMKLGNTVQITTHTHRKKAGWFVSLRWSDFSSGKLLSSIEVVKREVPAIGTIGTTVEILGLSDLTYWQGEQRLTDLEVKLSTLVSPFEEFSTFKIAMTVDGKPIHLEKVSKNLRHAATTQFLCSWNGKRLSCTARCKLALFATGADSDQFEPWVQKDRGAALYRHLKRSDGAKDFNLQHSQSKGWDLELTKEWSLDELSGRRSSNKSPVDPGPFNSELDAFSLADSNAENDSLGLQLVEFRKLIKRLAGVRIYRNGFAIRMEEDWLQLGRSQTSGASYYGLKPGNTIGFVALTAARNPLIQEKSDREGFIDSPAVRGFRDLMDKFAEFANDSLTFLRREYVAFRIEMAAKQVDLEPAWQPEDAVARLRELATAAKRTRRAIETSEKGQRQAFEKTQRQIESALSEDIPKRARTQLKQAQVVIRTLVHDLEDRRQELASLIKAIADEEQLGSTILERFGQMRTQIDEVYETVGLGLVAQALAHDMHSIVDDLLTRTQRIARKVKESGDPALGGYLEAVRTTSNLIRKQLTFLDPMLRTAREGRSTFSLSSFVREFVDLRRDRLSRFDINVFVVELHDFTIRFNRGRLLQVFDNLFRNAEYWLRQHSANSKESLVIHVEISSPCITIWDSGIGVSKAVEHTLFDLFVSDKPKTEGTGLGLFIVRQLLQQEGCSVRLEPERNRRGKRYKFTVDLGEVIPDE